MNGADIRAARLDLGLSQAQAAALWGINVRTLQDIEQGRSEARTTLSLLETIIRYHRAFGPPPEDHPMKSYIIETLRMFPSPHDSDVIAIPAKERLKMGNTPWESTHHDREQAEAAWTALTLDRAVWAARLIEWTPPRSSPAPLRHHSYGQRLASGATVEVVHFGARSAGTDQSYGETLVAAFMDWRDEPADIKTPLKERPIKRQYREGGQKFDLIPDLP